MKCIENILYLIFSAESDQKNMCIVRVSVPLSDYVEAYRFYNADTVGLNTVEQNKLCPQASFRSAILI